jgi:hypothetical protein
MGNLTAGTHFTFPTEETMKVFTAKQFFKTKVCTLLLVTVASQQIVAAESITEAFTNGKTKLSFRLRYEDVDLPTVDADLLSLKTRLTYASDTLNGLGVLLEMDDITHLTEFEGQIADPEGTEINQATLSYVFGDTTAKYGRQRILLDNQRFVGGVGFRQNEQTYDALSFTNKSIGDTEVFLANVTNVNRIFGELVASGDHSNETILFNAKYSGLSAGAISAYAYLIDNEDAQAMSSDTMGVRFAGKAGMFSYAAEFATQSDGGDSPLSYDAEYLLAEGGIKLGEFNLTLGYEVLGSDGANGQFITPFATLHAFQGWTDVFLGGGTGNISGGIEDTYFKAATKFAGLGFLVKYHQFSADDASVALSSDYGSEIGFEITKSWDIYGLSLKYADYSEDGFNVDTKKLWVTGTANF